jgi:carbon storage regulator CsrA
MLVLTRRQNEKILFPSLGITVHVLRLNGNTAKIGIDAPPNVKIVRDELRPTAGEASGNARSDHDLANALSRATLAIHLARKQWQVGRPDEAESSLETALQTLEELERTRHKPVSPPARRCKALIVEDDANQRELLASLLGMGDCECATAADGEAALAHLEAGGRPDVIFMDMAMPRCDGPEALRRIRSDDRYAKLRVYSVSSTPPTLAGVPDGSTGFDGWFPKPLDPRRLWHVIHDAMRSPVGVN